MGCTACRPGPGHELVETRIWPEIDELVEHVSEVGLRIDAVQFAGFDERSNAGPVLRSLVVTSEERILPIKYNLAVILPISGRMLWSNIGGIHCTGRGFVVFGASAGHRVSWCTLSSHPA
jgi:hypothetical protein